ncbi:MAG: type VI secretion system tip protein VgrG [Pseudomonadales bacterium]|nr:type VI secretion system tip protein VgrG [Pseudomonadales bacterium]
MTVPANVTRFLFEIIGDDSAIRVVSFEIKEAISEPFSIQLIVAINEPDMDIAYWVKKSGVLTLFDTSQPRQFHGIIVSASQLESGSRFTTYRLQLAPKFFLCNHRSNFRVFQGHNVPAIIQKLFSELNLQDSDYSLQLSKSYPPREYCVQYDETDFHFISRLMEEEGIFYFFEHHPDKHVMVIGDANSVFLGIDGTGEVNYSPRSGMNSGQSIVYDFGATHQATITAVCLGDFNSDKPRLTLREEASVRGGSSLERYHYPGSFKDAGAGKLMAQQTLESSRQKRIVFRGESDHQWLEAGRYFALKMHPRSDWNSEYLLTSVKHSGTQPQSLEEGAVNAGMEYQVGIVAVPKDTVYRPEVSHPKQLIDGMETAIVTGPMGEEIYTDDVGRIKVQFHWDRDNRYDERSSCWLRVNQAWAGKEWGAITLPRVGEEVAVSFLNGDPDRPIVTGALYNGVNQPPYSLPSHKSRTCFKSASYPGLGGYNELRIEDQSDDEQIFLRTERDLEIFASHDHKELIENDSHLSVSSSHLSNIDASQHVQVSGDWFQYIGKTHSLSAGRELQLKVSGSLQEQAGKDIHVKAGTQIHLQAGTQLTLKAGAGFVVLNPSGVTIKGPLVRINSGGSAGSAQGASPDSPQKPTPAEKGHGG